MPSWYIAGYERMRGPAVTGAGGSLDPATTAWINAVNGDGGSVSGTQQGFVDTLIKGLKTDGLFSIMDRIWIYANFDDTSDANSHEAKFDIITASANIKNENTPGSSFTMVNKQGYTSDGSTATCLDSQFNPSTAGGNYSLNSATIFSYVRTSRTTAVNYCEGGAFDGTSGHRLEIFPLAAGSFLLWSLNDNRDFATAPANAQGLWVATRTGASTTAVYGPSGSSTPFATGSLATGAIPNFNINSFGEGVAGGVSNPSQDQIAIFGFGAGLTATQATNLSNRLNAYMTSLGTNVY